MLAELELRGAVAALAIENAALCFFGLRHGKTARRTLGAIASVLLEIASLLS